MSDYLIAPSILAANFARLGEEVDAVLAAGADTTIEGTGAPGFAGWTAADLARAGGFTELADVICLDLITRAFAERSPPLEMTDSMQLSDAELEEVQMRV